MHGWTSGEQMGWGRTELLGQLVRGNVREQRGLVVRSKDVDLHA